LGVGAYRLAVDGIAAKLRLAREAGADGFVLFSHESLARSDRARLRAALLGPAPPAAPPVAPAAVAPAAAAAAAAGP
jgi:hypothetical protein